jgi:hypothetical protein
VKRVLVIACALGLIFAFLFWWFWPREWLTDQMLAQIKPGMTVDEVKKLLGEPSREYGFDIWTGVFPLPNEGGERHTFQMVTLSSPWLPTLRGEATGMRNPTSFQTSSLNDNDPPSLFWVGHNRVLFVRNDTAGKVAAFQVVPVTRSGGGLWGWIISQREKLEAPKPSPTVIFVPPVPSPRTP